MIKVLPSKYVLKRTAQVTIVAAAISISLSTGIRWLAGTSADGITIAVRLVLPFLIAIPISLVWFSRLEKLDRSYTKLLTETRQLAAKAAADPLTGLLNRRSFIEQFEVARSHDVSGTFLLADVDYLKTINDSHGHLAGDDAIIATGEALVEVLGNGTLIGRIGGDEFCAFIPGLLVNAASTSHAINETATRLFRERSGIDDIDLSLSIGVQALKPGFTFRELFARSDASLYRKKKQRPERQDAVNPRSSQLMRAS